MIRLHRLNGTEFLLNAELIEQIDIGPDTVITLTTGNNIIVRESAESVVEKIEAYRASVLAKSAVVTSNRRPEMGFAANG